MSGAGFLLISTICFLLVFLMYRMIKASEDKSREFGLYYAFVGVFAHLLVPILAPILGIAFVAGIVSLVLAFARQSSSRGLVNFSKELLRIGQETASKSSKALIEASAGGVLFGAGELQT